MTLDDRLTDAFDRGLRDGIESLDPVERDLFRIQDFIIEYEMGGLSGYFYNRLPDHGTIQAAVTAMKANGLVELAGLLQVAASLFTGYVETSARATWGEVLRKHDPNSRFDCIERRIRALSNYGIKE